MTKKDQTLITVLVTLIAILMCFVSNSQHEAIKTLQRQIEQRDSLINALAKASRAAAFHAADKQPPSPALPPQVSTTARVTYYTLHGKTASGIHTRKGICAVSHDLEAKGFQLGEYVKVEGYGTYLIADRTAKRIKNTIDIWLPSVPRRSAAGQKASRSRSYHERAKITLIYDND